jgi:hypothetical protein
MDVSINDGSLRKVQHQDGVKKKKKKKPPSCTNDIVTALD